MNSLVTPPRLASLLECLERDKSNLFLRKEAVREASDNGCWDAARNLLETGLALYADDAELLALCGSVHLQAQCYEDAEKVLSSALTRGLDDPALHYNLAFAQFMQKRYADALQRLMLQHVIDAVPVALVLRARCLYHLQRPEQSIRDCEQYLAVNPDDATAHGLLALLLQEEHRYDESSVHVKAALRQSPTQLEALLALASMQSHAFEDAAAQDSYSTLLLQHPNCGRAWLGLGLLKLRQMQLADAKRDLEFAAAYMPEHVGTWHALAWIAILNSDVDAACFAFEQAVALDRNFGETHGGLAVIAALQGREEDARSSIGRALRLDRQSASARYAEMLLLQRNGRYEEARAVLDAFLSSPVAQSEMQYRDLARQQMERLVSDGEQRSDPTVLH